MKKCPYCAEEIKDEAIKCKHCGEMLETKKPEPESWKDIIEDENTENKASSDGGKGPGCLGLFFLIVILMVIGSNISSWLDTTELDPEEAKENQQLEAERMTHPEKFIEKGALSPYDRKNYPKFYRKFGSKRMKQIEKLRKKAAIAALRSGKCDRVELSELSTKATRKNLKFFIDCVNGERLFVTGKELSKKNPKLVAASELALPETVARERCEQLIKSKVTFPSSVDIHWFSGTIVQTNKRLGNVTVNMNFDAKNAFGAKLPYMAICIFTPDGTEKIQIIRR